MEQMIENNKRSAQKAVNQATDALRDVNTKSLMDQAQHWYGTAKPYLNDVAKKSTTLTRNYPLQALVGAMFFGFICSMLFRRKVI